MTLAFASLARYSEARKDRPPGPRDGAVQAYFSSRISRFNIGH